MIINIDRDPSLSLYYLGSVILQILQDETNNGLEILYKRVKEEVKDIHVDFFYYALDWLFMLSLITFDDGRVLICESKNL